VTTWSKDELRKIAEADDLHISPFREDGLTYGTPTWIWSVAVDDALYVRGYNGQNSRWYQAAVRQKAGRIIAAGMTKEITFEPVDGPINKRIDDAYRAKYHGSPYLSSISKEVIDDMTALAGWENFYVIVGSAAGALIGLQFVVVTLIADSPALRVAEGVAAFATPTIVHFGVVLLLAWVRSVIVSFERAGIRSPELRPRSAARWKALPWDYCGDWSKNRVDGVCRLAVSGIRLQYSLRLRRQIAPQLSKGKSCELAKPVVVQQVIDVHPEVSARALRFSSCQQVCHRQLSKLLLLLE
jgi:hypothetical protein